MEVSFFFFFWWRATLVFFFFFFFFFFFPLALASIFSFFPTLSSISFSVTWILIFPYLDAERLPSCRRAGDDRAVE